MAVKHGVRWTLWRSTVREAERFSATNRSRPAPRCNLFCFITLSLVMIASSWWAVRVTERQILHYATHLTTPPVLSPGGTDSSQLTWQAKVETRMHLFIVYVWAKYSVYYQPSSGWLWPLLGELLSWSYVTDRKNKYRTLSFRAECCSKFYFKISPQLQLYPQNSIICNLYSVMSLREN